MRFEVGQDKASRVVYIRRCGTAKKIKKSKPVPGDDYILLDLTESNEIVGVTLLFPTDLSHEEWLAQGSRDHIPKDLRAMVDKWYENNGRKD